MNQAKFMRPPDFSLQVLMRCHQCQQDRLALAIYRKVLPLYNEPAHLFIVLRIHLRAERVPISTCLRFVVMFHITFLDDIVYIC